MSLFFVAFKYCLFMKGSKIMFRKDLLIKYSIMILTLVASTDYLIIKIMFGGVIRSSTFISRMIYLRSVDCPMLIIFTATSVPSQFPLLKAP